jgi:hypothetical protein
MTSDRIARQPKARDEQLPQQKPTAGQSVHNFLTERK